MAVNIPAQKPAARMAFVPPVRPLAMVRISCPVRSFTINKTKGHRTDQVGKEKHTDD